MEDPTSTTGAFAFGLGIEIVFDEEGKPIGVVLSKGRLGWGIGVVSQEIHTKTTDDISKENNGTEGYGGGRGADPNDVGEDNQPGGGGKGGV